jgi:outer membrane protein assembly factor BamB
MLPRLFAAGLLAAVVARTDAATNLAASVTEAPSWNCFRGPAQGVSPWTNAPVSWDGKSGKGVLWKTPLSMSGAGSPVVCGTRVYLSEGDEIERAVLAFDAATGKLLWRQVVKDGGADAPLPSVNSVAGFAAPTPVCDPDGVYALFATGDLVAFSPEGKLRWQVFLDRPDNQHGQASSLSIGDGRVYVQYDQKSNGRVLVLRTADGKTAWEVARNQGMSWSSPILAPAEDGTRMLLLSAENTISAYNAATGTSLWEAEGVTGEITPSLTHAGGRLYAVNDNSRLVCYRLAAKPAKLWELTENLPGISSPVVANGFLFLATSAGQLACVDTRTGKPAWVKDAGTCYSSLVASGDRVYAVSRDGITTICEAAGAFRRIATCDLAGEAVDATPAFGDGRIYLRSRQTLWCLGSK